MHFLTRSSGRVDKIWQPVTCPPIINIAKLCQASLPATKISSPFLELDVDDVTGNLLTEGVGYLHSKDKKFNVLEAIPLSEPICEENSDGQETLEFNKKQSYDCHQMDHDGSSIRGSEVDRNFDCNKTFADFQLTAVVRHLGLGVSRGHYICDAIDKNEISDQNQLNTEITRKRIWKRYDDSLVTPIAEVFFLHLYVTPM